MRKIIVCTVIFVAFILNGCSGSNSQANFKDMAEIEKLSKEEFSVETLALCKHVMKEMDRILDKHSKINTDFEEAIAKLHNSSVKQMIEYGKVLVKKDKETRRDSILNTLMAMWDGRKDGEAEAFEEKFDKRMPELEASGSESLGRRFNDLFGIMDFLDFEEAKERHPETAKEFGIQ